MARERLEMCVLQVAGQGTRAMVLTPDCTFTWGGEGLKQTPMPAWFTEVPGDGTMATVVSSVLWGLPMRGTEASLKVSLVPSTVGKQRL